MPARNRGNPLSLAVLLSLFERPMHPYEVATVLRQRGKGSVIKLNYGSLYAVFASLEKRKMVQATETQKEGRLPERTVYALTPSGRVEGQDWLTDLLASPVEEYPSFLAALSFMTVLRPEQVAERLRDRAARLTVELAQAQATQELMQKHHLPRVLWVEHELATRFKQVEHDYVVSLLQDIRSGELEGVDWWHKVHAEGVVSGPPGFTFFGPPEPTFSESYQTRQSLPDEGLAPDQTDE